MTDSYAPGINIYEFFSYEFTSILSDLLYHETAFRKLARRYAFSSIWVIAEDGIEGLIFRYLAEKQGILYKEIILKRHNWPIFLDYKGLAKSIVGFILIPLANLIARGANTIRLSSKCGNILICSGMRGTSAIIQALGKRYNIYCYHQRVQFKNILPYIKKGIVQVIGPHEALGTQKRPHTDTESVKAISTNENCAFKAFTASGYKLKDENCIIKKEPAYRLEYSGRK